jgi:hypothetical protein
MILYHFTDFWFLKNGGTILQEGLKAGPSDESFPPTNVVWLTTSPVAVWAIRPPECRISVVIPSHDRRLVFWKRWAQKHRPDLLEKLAHCDCGIDHGPAIETNYCYFGSLPLTMFRAVEYADPERRA